MKKKAEYLLSIIIVTKNSSKVVENAIDSILLQNADDVEIIIIDGKSSDSTIDIIMKYKDKIDVFVSEEDRGIYDAMNKGIKHSTGKYIYFLGSDDKLLVDLKQLDKVLLDTNTIYYGDVVLKNSTIYGGIWTMEDLIFRNICHQSIFYPSKIFMNNYYSLRYKYMADYAMNLKLWKKYKFQYINTVVAEYSTDGLSSRKRDNVFRIYSPFIILRYFGLKGLYYKFTNIFKKLKLLYMTRDK